MIKVNDETVAVRLDELSSAPLLSPNDLIAVARNRTTHKVQLSDVKALLQLGSDANFAGAITTSTPTPTNASWGFAEQGTYANWGGLVVSEGDTNILTFANGIYSKLDIPVKITGLANNISYLRNKPSNQGDIITLLGYYEKGDKNPLNYIYKTGVYTDDGGAVIVSGAGAWCAIFDTEVSVLDFGAVPNEDSTDAIQKAINYAIETKKILNLTSNEYLISGKLIIHRTIDDPNFEDKFYIKNGGLTSTTNLSMLWGDENGGKSSQLVQFENITFKTTAENGNVLMGNSIIRISFVGCSFIGIPFSYYTPEHLQSIYFINCNIRKWDNFFINAVGGVYDIRFSNCLVENGQDFINAQADDVHRVTNLVIDNCCVEGLSGAGIRIDGVDSCSITNNYFEKNMGGSIISQLNRDEEIEDKSILIQGNFFHIFADQENDNTQGNGYFHIVFNKVRRCFVKSNYAEGNLCFVVSTVADIEMGNSIKRGVETNILSSVGCVRTYYGTEPINSQLKWDEAIQKGSMFINNNYSVGQPIYWTCTNAGNYNTATWLPIYPLTQGVSVPNGSSIDTLLTSLRNAGIIAN